MKKGEENRNFDASGHLDDAIEDWQAAREECLTGCDPEKLERLTTATNVFYAAFARDWHDDQHMLPVAFEQFKKAVVEDGGNWDYRHLEVQPVYPHRDQVIN